MVINPYNVDSDPALYYWENTKENVETEENELEDDVNQWKEEWVEDMPKYDSHHFDNFKKGNHGIFDYWNYFRWILNAAFIGFPLTVISTICLILNLYTSIYWNKFWAFGNLFMISKTFYIMF